MSELTLSKCTKRDDILAGFKRVALCHQPTALEQMPRLTEALADPDYGSSVMIVPASQQAAIKHEN